MCTHWGGVGGAPLLGGSRGGHSRDAHLPLHLQHRGPQDLGLLAAHVEESQERDHLVVEQVDAPLGGEGHDLVGVDAALVLHLRLICQRDELQRALARVGVRELVGPRLQELQAVLIGPHNLKGRGDNVHRAPYVEVPELEVLARAGILHPPLLGKLAGLVAAVARLHLEDGDLLVGGVEGYDEVSHGIVGLAVGHLRLEAADLPGEGHELDEVYLPRLRLDGVHVADRVLLLADAVVRRRMKLPVPDWRLADVDPACLLVNAQELLVKGVGEVVAIVQHDLSVPHVDGLPDPEVLGQVGHRVGGEHPGDGDGATAGLVQRGAPHEDRIVVSPGVAAVGLVDLQGVVCKVVVDDKINPSTVQCGIIPKRLEP
mmetsp:Transcript_110397/g.296258  ORF Transcript_110397/g.296258 Transcript_110397/m.296258 type:complete len:372 (+) Transcript_110397:215-1330(+)